MSWVIAGLLWALVVAKTITRRPHASNVMLWCAVVFALSFSTDVGELFQPLDRFLGGWNITNIAGHLLFSTGVYLLSRSVITAALPHKAERVERWNRGLLGVVLLAQLATFSKVETTGSTDRFSVTYGTQDAALWYAMVEIVYTILVLGITALVALVHLGKFRAGRYRVGMLLTAIGCVLATATEITGIEYVLQIHSGTIGALSWFALQHDLLFALAALTLVTGFAVPSVAGWVRRWFRHHEARAKLVALRPIWKEATLGRQTIDLDESTPPSQQLHRMVVEIRDASRVDPEVARRLQERFDYQVEQTIEDSERFLAGHHV